MYLKVIRPLAKKIIPIKYRPLLLRSFYALRAPFYRGNNVSCPCCFGNFRRFLPYAVEGESARPNAQCPRCGAVERHRLIWLFLRDCTNLFSEKLKLLHIAPEPVFQRKFKSMSNLEYISADINSPLADVKMDITDIDYEDGVFDAILCSHVLDYVSDDIKALCELFRILKRGGWAILQSRIDKDREITFEDPSINTPEKKKLAFGQSDLCRIYGRDYIERIKSVGFQVREEAYGSVLGAEQCARYGLIEGEPVYFCLKPEN